MKRYLTLLASFVLSASIAEAASIEAVDNATVQPTGPRSGANGKAFFNVEGSNNGNFSSYGVIDFTFGNLGLGAVTGVQNVSLELTQSNSGFTADGPVSFYYTAANLVNIQPGLTVNYKLPNDGVASVDAAFAPLQFLGSGNFVEVTSGTVDSFALSFSGPALAGFVDAINNGTALRLVVTPDAPGTAATYAGATNFNAGGPTLVFDTIAVPEPATVILVPLSLLLTVLKRSGTTRT